MKSKKLLSVLLAGILLLSGCSSAGTGEQESSKSAETKQEDYFHGKSRYVGVAL